ncbi:MAG: DUF115 domain-containing protein [bacterium]|nr:DUF115 domain-containing protein [bacterium]
MSELNVEVIQSRRGTPTARVSLSGRPIMIHSLYDPLAEARKQVESCKIVPGCRVVVCGAGLGYVLEALDQQCSEAGTVSVLVLEPIPELYEQLKPYVNQREFLHSRPVTRVGGSDDLIDSARSFLNGTSPSMIRVLTNPGYQRLDPRRMDKMVSAVYKLMLYEGMNLMTGFLQGMRGFMNVARNIGQVAGKPGIKELFGLFKGVPAAVVSAGPSLDRSVDYLKELSGRMLIVAVDGALKPLLGHGIKPHLVVAADENPGNVRKFSGQGQIDGTALAVVPSVDPGVFTGFTGPVFMSHVPLPAVMWLEWMGIRSGTLEGWGSVASLAFDLTVKLGADPIVFFGQDCSYPRWKIYARGQGVEEAWSNELDRFKTLEKKNLDTVLKSGFKWDTDINGYSVPSAVKMAAYRDYLVTMIEQSGRTVMNASGEGILSGRGVTSVNAASLGTRFPRLTSDPAEMIEQLYRESKVSRRKKLVMGLNKCARAIDTIINEIRTEVPDSGVSLREAVTHPVVEFMLGAAVRLFLDGPLASGTATEQHLSMLRQGLEDGRRVVDDALAALEGGCPCIHRT